MCREEAVAVVEADITGRVVEEAVGGGANTDSFPGLSSKREDWEKDVSLKKYEE